jgi:serine/threonine protein kinase
MVLQTIDYERHTPSMDMFSLGVILFIMLTGHKPMTSEQAKNLAYSAFEAHEYPKMTAWTWKRLSSGAQSLVLRMLERDPLKRITARQVSLMAKHSLWYRVTEPKPHLKSAFDTSACSGHPNRFECSFFDLIIVLAGLDFM